MSGMAVAREADVLAFVTLCLECAREATGDETAIDGFLQQVYLEAGARGLAALAGGLGAFLVVLIRQAAEYDEVDPLTWHSEICLTAAGAGGGVSGG